MIKNVLYAGVLGLTLVLPQGVTAVEDPIFGNVYGEDGDSSGFVEGKGWKEQNIALPAYPDTGSRKLIEVDLLLKAFPFRLLIDPASVSIGEDRIVRYTAILKSRSGATSVFYEGIRCATGQSRRYAYGGQDGFQRSSNSHWNYIGVDGSDRYLEVLRAHFLCPAPAPGKHAVLLRRLRRPNPDNFFYGEEE